MNTTILHKLAEGKSRPASAVAIKYKEAGQWKSLSWQDYLFEIESTAKALFQTGVRSGDKVAIISNTRYEWSVCDFAILSLGAITIPIYQNSTPEDIAYILNNSEAKVLICENRGVLNNWRKIKSQCASITKLVCFEMDRHEDIDVVEWTQFQSLGETCTEFDFYKSCRNSKPSDVVSILYTSGTTGAPKGVVITHAQITSEVMEAFPLCGVNSDDITLSFLPYAHVMGRIEHWGHGYIGYTLAFAESIDKLKGNLLEVQPTIMVAVPRIFEKIYSTIQATVETSAIKRKLFAWSISVGKEIGEYRQTRETIPLHLVLTYELAKRLVLDKVQAGFGGRLRFAISGGAPLSKDIGQFFYSAGILVLEGYGLTETTAAITVNTPFSFKFGTVGKPIGDVQIRIAEDGEVLVKSQKVMKEYFKNPTATAEVLHDGWFSTGDIGEITSSGELRITDRKKDLIKTAGGKYVAPQRLEGLLKMSPIISNAVIHGDQEKFIVALLTLDKAYVMKMARENGMGDKEYSVICESEPIKRAVKEAVSNANSSLASFETIKRYTILYTDFTIESGELTPSLKVKRKYLEKKYKDRIQAMYL